MIVDELYDDAVGLVASATFSDDRRQRLALYRRLRVGPRRLCFVMLNPSTADGYRDDPTLREVIWWASRLAFDCVEVVNLFTVRTPHPRDLVDLAVADLGCGLDADVEILTAAERAEMTIAAWGNGGVLRGRGLQVAAMLLRSRRVQLRHLGLTLGGFPKHPLARGVHRIPRTLTPIAWEPA